MVRRTKELPQGIIDVMQDGDFMMAVSRLENHADSPESVAEVADRIADARERYDLSVDEMGTAVRLAQVAMLDTESQEV